MERKWTFRINGTKLKRKLNRSPIVSLNLRLNNPIKGYISMRMIDS